jgi:hypothetical protein
LFAIIVRRRPTPANWWRGWSHVKVISRQLDPIRGSNGTYDVTEHNVLARRPPLRPEPCHTWLCVLVIDDFEVCPSKAMPFLHLDLLPLPHRRYLESIHTNHQFCNRHGRPCDALTISEVEVGMRCLARGDGLNLHCIRPFLALLKRRSATCASP